MAAPAIPPSALTQAAINAAGVTAPDPMARTQVGKLFGQEAMSASDNTAFAGVIDGALSDRYIKLPFKPALSASAIGGQASAEDIARRNYNADVLLAAIDRVRSIVGLSNTAGRIPNKVILLANAGAFAFPINFNALVDFPGLVIRGQGRRSTHFLLQTNSAFLDFGTPTTAITTGTVFDGNAQDWELSDLAIYNNGYLSITNHGIRFGSAIRDTGSGHGLLRNVRVGGFGYGVNLVCGSDFTCIDNLYCELNDVGFYAGPGSQQILATNLDTYLNRENMVLDRPGQITFLGPIFNSGSQSNVTIEAPGATSTRQLTQFPTSGTTITGEIAIEDAWYESNAGGLGDAAIALYHNLITSNVSNEPYRNIRIVRPYVVNGRNPDTGREPQGFLGRPNDATLGAFDSEVTDGVAQGNMTAWFVRQGNGMALRNPRGSSAILFSNQNNTDVLQDGVRDIRRRDNFTTNPLDRVVGNYLLNAGMRERVSGNGLVSWGFASGTDTWTQAAGFDLTAKRLFMGDPAVSATPTLSWSAAMPTAGAYGAGSVVYNSAPTVSAGKVLTHWVRLTTGSAHVVGTDWQALYASTS